MASGGSEQAGGARNGASAAEPILRRKSIVRWSAEGGRRAMDADRWSHAAAMAKLAATLLQGRALLSGEARALLSSATVPGAEETNWREAFQLAALLGQVRLGGAVAAPVGKRADARRRLRCQRCGSGEAQLRRAACLACGRDCAYCEACILMGRSRECELLVRGVYDSPVWKEHGLGRWKAMRKQNTKDRLGKWGLSPAQRDATAKALDYLEERPAIRQKKVELSRRLKSSIHAAFSRFLPPASYSERKTRNETRRQEQLAAVATVPSTTMDGRAEADIRAAQTLQVQKAGAAGNGKQRFPLAAHPEPDDNITAPDRRFLIWAVTGAGKTEMVFPLVESVVNRGGRACIASPRRDVVLELDPRIRKAFPGASIVTLYGGSEQRWDGGEITLSTTHQLIRFHEAFDLIIIDELDAYPYHGNPMLYYAADKCRLRGAPTLLLSATPPSELQRDARRGKLAHARVPVRYHRHPLPVPKLLGSPSVRQLLIKGRLPRSLMQALQHSLGRGAQVFLFVQRISQSEPMAALLRKQWPALPIEATSSQDPDRADKVTRFRSAATRLLVTTTILERGVTIPRSDVFILDADGQLFDEASLVQMAGRAGRSADDPAGRVYFVAIARTRSQLKAVRHIKGMNRTAAKRGFLLSEPPIVRRDEP
jgi:competence protein ComFA